jgi:flagellar protein FlaJ
VKVHSGRPLLNALIEGSQSYGVASKYFKEIVEDINLGTPIEKALDNAVKYSPSDKFRRILFQVNTALKVGIDVSIPLTNVIEEITAEQLTEIQRYGKKLNSLALFYMLLAIVLPSIGMAIFVVVGGLLGLPIDRDIFMVVIGVLVLVQLIFISIFKTSRLSVNL